MFTVNVLNLNPVSGSVTSCLSIVTLAPSNTIWSNNLSVSTAWVSLTVTILCVFKFVCVSLAPKSATEYISNNPQGERYLWVPLKRASKTSQRQNVGALINDYKRKFK